MQSKFPDWLSAIMLKRNVVLRNIFTLGKAELMPEMFVGREMSVLREDI
jgi:hypothetical protein